MTYALYYAGSPAPKRVDREALQRLVAVHFSTEQDAFHAPAQIEEKCRPTLELFKQAKK